jgi:hypothetical protein
MTEPLKRKQEGEPLLTDAGTIAQVLRVVYGKNPGDKQEWPPQALLGAQRLVEALREVAAPAPPAPVSAPYQGQPEALRTEIEEVAVDCGKLVTRLVRLALLVLWRRRTGAR